MDEKKRWERIFLDGALESAGLGKPDEIEHGDRPDFILNFGERRVGVEITELVDRPHREQESLRSRVLGLASRLWRERGFPPLRASVLFNPQHRLTRDDVQCVAEQLVTVAEANLPAQGESRRIRPRHERRSLLRHVDSIGLSRLAAQRRALWVPSDGGCVPTVTPERIQAVIDGKEEKIRGYSQGLDQCWLLLCIDGFCISSMFDLDPACLDHKFRSSFDRVGCFDRGSKATVWFHRVAAERS